MSRPIITPERKGELLLCGSSLMFALITLLVKVASRGASGFFIATWRFIVGVIVTISIMKVFRLQSRIENKKEWILRGIFGSAAMVCFYLSIQLSTISRASLLCNTSPVFVAIFGYFFFRDKIRVIDIISLIVCFSGVVFIFYDRGTYTILGDLLGLLSGIFSGVAIHYVKRSSLVNNALVVYLSPCLIGLVFIPFSLSDYSTLTIMNFLLILLIGILTLVAHYFMTSGYRAVCATKGSILNYLQIPITIGMGARILHDTFPFKLIIGMVLVCAGILITLLKSPFDKEVPLIVKPDSDDF